MRWTVAVAALMLAIPGASLELAREAAAGCHDMYPPCAAAKGLCDDVEAAMQQDFNADHPCRLFKRVDLGGKLVFGGAKPNGPLGLEDPPTQATAWFVQEGGLKVDPWTGVPDFPSPQADLQACEKAESLGLECRAWTGPIEFQGLHVHIPFNVTDGDDVHYGLFTLAHDPPPRLREGNWYAMDLVDTRSFVLGAAVGAILLGLVVFLRARARARVR